MKSILASSLFFLFYNVIFAQFENPVPKIDHFEILVDDTCALNNELNYFESGWEHTKQLILKDQDYLRILNYLISKGDQKAIQTKRSLKNNYSIAIEILGKDHVHSLINSFELCFKEEKI